MAFSLHRKKGSPYWYAWFRVPDPKAPGGSRQVSKSTRRERKGDAELRARELEEVELKKAGAGDEVSDAVFSILKDAADLATRGELNEARARGFLSKMLEASTGKGLRVYTVREWFKNWLADKEKSNSQGAFVRYKAVADNFLAFLPATRADGNLMNLTPEEVRAFRDAELDSGKAPSTVNLSVKVIRIALNKARKAGVIFNNPADAVETVAEDADFEKATFTPSDLARVLAASEGSSWQGVTLFGFYTGANLRDITNLRWDQIDLAAGTVSYTRKKTGRAVTLPLHPQLSDWLLSLSAPDDPKAFVFSDLAGKSSAGKSGLSMQFARKLAKAGITGEAIAPRESEDGGKTKGRTRNTLSFHSLRHSFNSAMANAGVNQEVRQKLTGHASAKMNSVYTHHELTFLRAAVEAVPSIGERRSG